LSRSGLLGALAALLVLALPAAVARADADPPSDILLTQDTYFPYQPAVSPQLGVALTKLVADARKSGAAIKLAIVASNLDLGAIPDLFAQPQRYADFLGQELALGQPGGGGNALLVVMPQGFGYAGTGSNEAEIIKQRPVNATTAGHVDSDLLAQAAGRAIVDLSAATGHPLHDIPGQFLPAGVKRGGGGSNVALIVALAALLLLAGGAIALRLRAQASSRGD
jgi:hypothetical protein